MPSLAGGWKYAVFSEELNVNVCHVVVRGLSETYDDLYHFKFHSIHKFKGNIFSL
jgi:hypothetical protein